MLLHPTVGELALRLLAALAAGLLVGANRGERGHAAGLRTTGLVCLAAAVAMVQANLLLATSGRTADLFASMDVMRLPLGVLSGMGFIGAGAILRRSDVVTGVTTAATLWLMTIVGLCFGGGQLALGGAATLLALFVLKLLKRIDRSMPREHKALLEIHLGLGAPLEPRIVAILDAASIRSTYVDGRYDRTADTAELVYDLRWKSRSGAGEPRDVIVALLDLPTVRRVVWNGAG